MTVSLSSKILFYCVQTSVLSIGDIGHQYFLSLAGTLNWLCFTQTFTSSSSASFFLAACLLSSPLSQSLWRINNNLTKIFIFLDGADVSLLVWSLGQLQHSCPDCREIQQGLSGSWWSTPTLGSHVAVQDMTVHCTGQCTGHPLTSTTPW